METLTAKQKIFNFPLTKIVLSLIVCLAFIKIGQAVFGDLLAQTSLDRDARNLIKGIIVSALAIGSYVIFFKKYEKREITEFSLKGIGKNLLIGTLMGAVLQSLTIWVIYLYGGYTVVAVNPVSFIIIPLAVAFTVAIIEEILFRGILFRIVEEKLGSYIALLISGFFFSVLHLLNDHSTLLSSLSIGIVGGGMFGAVYIYSRNLWMPIALHFSWNFFQSGIFGAITSGNANTKTLIRAKIEGLEIITGGEFGPEATIQTIVFCTIVTIILIVLCHKENKIVLPYWKK